MRLPVAPQSRRASTECSSLVSIVLISTSRSKEVPHTSKVLIERSLGSLFSHLGLQSGAKTRGIEGSMSTSSLSIVLESSIVNTVNLFTGDQDTFIAGRAMQNPLCHKLHSAISPSILHLFSRSQWLRKALEKTFLSVPVTSRGDQ